MVDILNGKYRKLKEDAIGQGSQTKVFLCEKIDDKKKFFYFNSWIL